MVANALRCKSASYSVGSLCMRILLGMIREDQAEGFKNEIRKMRGSGVILTSFLLIIMDC